MNLINLSTSSQGGAGGARPAQLLEEGNILMVHPTPFMPVNDDCEFLRSQRQSAGKSHKNISYKPGKRRVSGAAALTAPDVDRLNDILRRYSEGALGFMRSILPDYAGNWHVDYASFRPVEEEGRDLPIRRRNDLMHVDAFPTRPTNGARILRLFTNIHPSRDRVWGAAGPFEDLVERYATDARLPEVLGASARVRRMAAALCASVGIGVPVRSPYDEFMLRFHHYLKTNTGFQRDGQQYTFTFPPGASWISFTDQIAHRVLSGQYALEQTCIVPIEDMTLPARTPLAVLERAAGKPLTHASDGLAAGAETASGGANQR